MQNPRRETYSGVSCQFHQDSDEDQKGQNQNWIAVGMARFIQWCDSVLWDEMVGSVLNKSPIGVPEETGHI